MANVILLGTTTVGVTALAKLTVPGSQANKANAPLHRILIGGALYVGLLALLDMANPAIASGLAVVVLITALLLNGVPLITALGKVS